MADFFVEDGDDREAAFSILAAATVAARGGDIITKDIICVYWSEYKAREELLQV